MALGLREATAKAQRGGTEDHEKRRRGINNLVLVVNYSIVVLLTIIWITNTDHALSLLSRFTLSESSQTTATESSSSPEAYTEYYTVNLGERVEILVPVGYEIQWRIQYPATDNDVLTFVNGKPFEGGFITPLEKVSFEGVSDKVVTISATFSPYRGN